MPKMNGFINENHWGGPTMMLLNVVSVLGMLNVPSVLDMLKDASFWPAGPCV